MSFERFKEIVYGNESQFGLRELIFHQVCFLSSVALTFGLLLTLRISQWDLSLVIVITLLALTLSYWLSRVMKKFTLGLILFVVIAYILIIFNYFLNGGINGPTSLISVLILAIFYASSFSGRHWIWTLLHGLIFCGLTYYEFIYDRKYIVDYENSEQRYSDIALTYLFTLAFLFLIFRLIRRAYELQKEKVDEQRKSLEKGKEDLEKSNQELIKVLSIIAHDVRNPLASIESFLELSADGGLLEEERKTINRDLHQMVQHTSHMLDDMVNWSKIQISGQTTNFHSRSLGSWLNKTVDHMKQLAKAKGVLFNADYNGRQKLFCDPILMTVIVRNLIQNAVKFTPPGKTVDLKVIQESKDLVFEIQDEGIGMTEDERSKLFTDKSVAKSGTQQERGSGFGLLIVYEYVQLHGGTISVDSELNEGSRFKVLIPYQRN